jgi:hypothetical protein
MMARYDDLTCPIQGCGEVLYITWKYTRPVFAQDTTRDLADPENAYTGGWEIGCEDGHVVLLPVNAVGAAHDMETFGGSDDDEDRTETDLNRLHQLVGLR